MPDISISTFAETPSFAISITTDAGTNAALILGSYATFLDFGNYDRAYVRTSDLIDHIIEADVFTGREQRRLDAEDWDNYIDLFIEELRHEIDTYGEDYPE